MKKNYLFLMIGIALMWVLPTYAQSTEPIRCGTDEHHEQQMQNPEYATKFRAIQQAVHSQLQGRTPSCASPLIIPVAVHFSGAITGANMTCIQDVIDDQIEVLNEDFGGYNADIANYCNHASNCPTEYPPNVLAGTTCIQFCLATMNHPAGSGLSNGDAAITFGTYTFDSGAALWAGYLNIFVSDIPPNGYGAGLLGLAPLFGAENPNGNGVFITASAFGGNAYSCMSGIALNSSGAYNRGRTGTHELGHYFGLQHVFHGNCANGDGIADTPNQETDNAGVPTINYATCTSTAINSCGTQDFFFNYMDYVQDAAMYMFTSDQADVMNTAANAGMNHATNPYKVAATVCGTLPNTYNPTFLNGCPVNSPPQSAFSTSDTAPYEYCPAMNEITFTDQSTGFPTSWSWTFSGAGVSPTTSTDQNPTIQVNSTGTLTVTLTATNTAGADPSPATMNYSIVILPAQDCGDCGESFVDPGGAGGNYANNTDMTYTLCTADPADVIVVDFTSIDLGTTGFEDYILVTHGTTAATNTSNTDYLVMLSHVYIPQGGGNFTSTGSAITSNQNCMTFRFISNGSGTGAGWQADVSCIAAPTCNDGMQNQDESYVDCGGVCATCPSTCDGFTFYDAGGLNNPTGGDFETWQICADAGRNVIVDFTSVDMTPFNNGVLRVYDAVDDSGAYTYYVSGTGVYVPAGGNSVSPYGNSTITSSNECFFFKFTNGGTGNGWVADVSCSAALPLTLVDFQATINTANVELTWTTENEEQSEQFIIQRMDGNTLRFEDIGSVQACGTCVEQNHYSFTDTDVQAANSSYTYRLKMTDFDGQFTYSNILQARMQADPNAWSVYPNPGKGTFSLELNPAHNATALMVLDKLGRKVYEQELTREQSLVSLQLNELASGVYRLVVLENGVLTTKPLVILP